MPNQIPKLCLVHPYLGVEIIARHRGVLHAHYSDGQFDDEGHPTNDSRALEYVAKEYADLGHTFVGIAPHRKYLESVPDGGIVQLRAGEIYVNNNNTTQHQYQLLSVPAVGTAYHRMESAAKCLEVVKTVRQGANILEGLGGLVVAVHPSLILNSKDQALTGKYYSKRHKDKKKRESAGRYWIGVNELLGASAVNGIEIFNGYHAHHSRFWGAWALDKWDYLLSRGSWLWGFADDDSFKSEENGIGWNEVWVEESVNPESLPQALIDAMVGGCTLAVVPSFACGTRSSVFVKSIDVSEDCDVLTICTGLPNESSLSPSTGRPHAYEAAASFRVISNEGLCITAAPGPDLVFQMSELRDLRFTPSYIRVECAGASGAITFTQPFKTTAWSDKAWPECGEEEEGTQTRTLLQRIRRALFRWSS